MRRALSVFLFLLSFASLGQELNCTVQVLAPQVAGTTDKRVFETMQTTIFEFMNNTKWTKDIFLFDERIECSMLINIQEKLSTDEYRATIQVQSRRPVYKSSYNSVLLNHADEDFQIRYLEFQALEYNENTFLSNLTSVLSYYAYMIIGLDYDSYALNGGTPYFQKAQTIVANAQNAPEKGWKPFEGNKNRYWLVENLLNPVFAPLREVTYRYHRLGLDVMVADREGGRKVITDCLDLLQRVHNDRPLSYNMQVYFYAKADELVNVFSNALPVEKNKAITVLNNIDPGNSTKYQKIQR